MEGFLEKQANIFRVWRTRWFELTKEGLLSYWLQKPSETSPGMARCTRHTRDITSVFSKQGYFSLVWKDGSTWNMRAKDNTKHVDWVVILKQMSTISNPPSTTLSPRSTGNGNGNDNAAVVTQLPLGHAKPASLAVAEPLPARAVAVVRQVPPPTNETFAVQETRHTTSTHAPVTSTTQKLSTATTQNYPPRQVSTNRRCPACNSDKLKVKPRCSACLHDFFLLNESETNAASLETCLQRGQYLWRTDCLILV